jgi:3-dehydroquinate synthase
MAEKIVLDLPAGTGARSEITIGAGLMDSVPERLERATQGRTLFWIWDERVWSLWGEKLARAGWPGPYSGRMTAYPASESSKRLSTVESLARELVAAGADRGSALVAVGGGVTGDVAGFLASIYMRGIPHFQIPTTLLAQVDSSVGGKTGVDLPEGKNLLGSFQQPLGVWIDPAFLTTLPAEEFRQGMAETVKAAMIGDPALWLALETFQEEIRNRDAEVLEAVIAAAVRLKAAVVQADEREAGRRRVLNLGHTAGHALERLSGYRMRHGDAVSIGMAAAAAWSESMGLLPSSHLRRLERLCVGWNLPVRPPPSADPDEVVAAMASDKKRFGSKLHFILPLRIGRVADRDDLDPEELKEVLRRLQAGRSATR